MTFGKILLTLSPFGQSLEGTSKAAALHLSKLMLYARIFQISVTLRKFSRNEMCISSHITMYIKLLHLMDHAQNYIFTNDASWSSFDDTHIGIMHMNHSYNFFNFWVARLVVAFMPVTSCRTNNAQVFPPYFRIQSFVKM